MISEALENYSISFHDDIQSESEDLGEEKESVFVSQMGILLDDYGETDTVIECVHQSHGLKVDGYCYDEELDYLILITSYFIDETDLSKARINRTDIDREMKRATNFFNKCLTDAWKDLGLKDSAYKLAELISESREKLNEVKFLLITDCIAPKEPSAPEKINDIKVSRAVWDIERAYRFYSTGEKEPIEIDFRDYCDGRPLDCAVLENNDSNYTTYLGFLPGKALADMYEKHGTKMLDMNVRVFLSGRGKINKGIKRTIIEEPEMFCAYNNGITVYSKNVKKSEGGNGLLTATDFQIINGGQTTASLFHSRKKDKADLGKIFVQMKLTEIHNDRVDKMVPLISEYSNSQNRVQIADLSANKKPHPEIQEISKKLPAPDPTGGSKTTYWFYERSRGSYEELKNLTAGTPAKKKKFEDEWPKKQKFDKLKLAKVWNTFIKVPWTVCLGGQKNFAEFNKWAPEEAKKDLNIFFKDTVSLLILWNETEKIIRTPKDKYPAYRHALVTYSLSWFFLMTRGRIDLDKIWKNQEVSQKIFDVLEELIEIVNNHIRKTDKSVDMYCRDKKCWDLLIKKDKNRYVLPDEIKGEYIKGVTRENIEVVWAENAAINFCKSKSADKWGELSGWLKRQGDPETKVWRSMCFNMGKTLLKGKDPSERLSVPCKEAWESAEDDGWDSGEPINLDSGGRKKTISI